MVLQLGFETFVLPALICATTFLVANRVAGRGAAAGFALAVGYVTGQWIAIGFPPIPPVETTQWLLLLAAAAGGVALFPFKGWLYRLDVSLLCAATVVISTNPMWRFHWETGTTRLWLAGLLVVLLLLWRSTAGLAKRAEAPVLTAVCAAAAMISSAILGMSATTLLAQLAATTTACLGVLFFFEWRKPLGEARWAPVALVILSGLVINGYFYAQLSGWSAISLAVALPAAWVSQLRRLDGKPAWVRTCVALAAITLATLPALTLAAIDFFQEPSDNYYDEY